MCRLLALERGTPSTEFGSTDPWPSRRAAAPSSPGCPVEDERMDECWADLGWSMPVAQCSLA